jgi:hypothetical protein
MKNKEIAARFVTKDHELQMDVGYGAKSDLVFCKIAKITSDQDSTGKPLIAITIQHDDNELICVFKPEERVTVRDASVEVSS